MKNFLIALSFTLGIIYLSCSDNPTSSSVGTPLSYPIWKTDSLGNDLGGDSNNFCFSPGNGHCSYLKGVYPNPVNNNFYIRVTSNASVNSADTVSLYFLNNNDSVWICKNQPVVLGTYNYYLKKDSLGFSPGLKQLNMIYKKGAATCMMYSPFKCQTWGNVLFN